MGIRMGAFWAKHRLLPAGARERAEEPGLRAVNIQAPACRGSWFAGPTEIRERANWAQPRAREPSLAIDLEAPPKGMELLQSARPVSSRHF